MMGFDVIKLIAKTYTIDELGQYIPNEASREALARVESVSQTEFFTAAQAGLKAEYKVVMSFAQDYRGEELAELRGRRYAIYRTYETPSGQIELYLRRETGEVGNRE